MTRRSVDIGGVALDVVVAGSGSVTVVFENGLATPLEEWDAVAPNVAQRARTLCYDRRRAAPAGPLSVRSAADMISDLETLLAALELNPPYLLVGHSWGGVVIRLFAHRHPSDVGGLVFVDATHEVIDSRGLALLPVMYALMGVASRLAAGRRWLLRQLCPAGAPPAYRALMEERLGDPALWAIGLRTARAEGAGIRPSLAELRRITPDLPNTPIQVLTAGGVEGPNVKSVRRVHEAWRAAVDRAPSAKYTNIPTSGHQLPIEEPKPVIEAILGVLDSIENGTDTTTIRT
jgi:pimeloyl-ACP methyl ester carboxylesterase